MSAGKSTETVEERLARLEQQVAQHESLIKKCIRIAACFPMGRQALKLLKVEGAGV